jgi:uncharacterized protein YkwD
LVGGALAVAVVVVPAASFAQGRSGASFSAATAATMLNDLRSSNGLPAVSLDPVLMRLAQQQARAMATHDRMSHEVGGDFRARLQGAGYRTREAAENICAGYHTLDAAFSSWRSSFAHRANMLLAGATRMGIAAAPAPNSAYGVYWAMILAEPAGAVRQRSVGGEPHKAAHHHSSVRHAQAATSGARPMSQ